MVPALLALIAGCGSGLSCPEHFGPGLHGECAVPGWPDRAYRVWTPDAVDGPFPVILDFHGGGGNPRAAERSTCAGGEVDSASCLHGQLARDHDFAVVYPAGTRSRIGNFRTWNAGGGIDGYRCTAGRACEEDVDDTAYVAALLDDLETRLAVDPARIYATGLSNGGAMSHRLGCTMSDRIAAIAPVGGAMQWTVNHDCAPSRPVPVLQIHGMADPCWKYEGGPSDCPVGQEGKAHVSVKRTLDEWCAIHGATGEPVTEEVEDRAYDGTTTTRFVWANGAVEHLMVAGGGHTWPRGYPYLGEDTVGRVTQDWGSERIVAFFEAHPMP